jgi:hypothetical protein
LATNIKEQRVTEIILALCALSWGVWLLLPFDTFSSSATFVLLARTAPEWVWGAFMCAGAITTLVGLYRRSCPVRRHGLIAMTIVWMIVWTSFAIGNWRSTAAVTYLWWAILCGYWYLRVQRNGSKL